MPRTTVALAAVVLVALVGSGGSYARWSSTATTSVPALTAGSLGIGLAGFEDLTVEFAQSALIQTAMVAVTNTGDVEFGHSGSFSLGAGSSLDLAARISVSIWPVAGLAECTAGSVPVSPAAGTWAQMPALTGTLPVGGAQSYCFQSGILATDLAAFPGQTVIPAMRVTATVGDNWTATSSATATQSSPASP